MESNWLWEWGMGISFSGDGKVCPGVGQLMANVGRYPFLQRYVCSEEVLPWLPEMSCGRLLGLGAALSLQKELDPRS